jgi:hypothetical protein
MATTINNIAIENKGNAIQIIESFGLSSKRVETIYFVMRVGKDAYVFVAANDAADFDKENHKSEVFGSQEAAAEAAHNLAVKTVEQLEIAFEIGYTEIAQNSTSTTTKLNQSAPIFYKGNIVSLIDWDSLTDAGLLYIKVKKAKFVAHVSELSNLDASPAPEADHQEAIHNNSDHARRIAGETPESAVKHFKKHHRPAGVSCIASLERGAKLTTMRKSVFINLSNHPSNNWNAKQSDAALSLAERIMDIPFPNVPPTDTVEDVAKMVKDVLNSISEIGRWQDIVIHVMGEATFVAQMVLTAPPSVPLVCSTTQRVSVDKEDGTKVSVFTFCKFRDLR